METESQSGKALDRQVIGLAMKVHRALGPGFLESVYKNALVFELKRNGLRVETEMPITVRYEECVVGEFTADLVVEGQLVIELKSAKALVRAHSVQMVNYLAATGMERGLLLNFGAESLEFKTKTRTYKPVHSAANFRN